MEKATSLTRKSLKRNFFVNALYSGVSVLFPLLTFPYITRVLLPDDIGRVSFATSVVACWLLLAQLGVPLYGIRACAEARDDRIQLSKTVHEIFLINTAMSLIACALFAASLVLIPRFRQDTGLMLIIGSTVILNSFGMEWLFRGVEDYSWLAIRSTVLRLIALILIFVFVKRQGDYAIYAALTVFAAIGSDILNVFRARRFVEFKRLGNYDFKRHIRPILVIFAMSCTITLYTNTDIVMLGFMKTNADVGCYHAAIKIKTALLAIIGALANVLMPRISYCAKNKLMDELYSLCRKAIGIVIIVALPLSVYCIAFAGEMLVFLLGQVYEAATVPMQVLMPIVLIAGITVITGIQFLIPLGKEKDVFHSTLIGAGVNLLVNFLLIPSLSCVGAAIGTLLTESTVLIIQVAVIRKMGVHLFQGTKLGIISVATIAALISSVWLKCLAIPLFPKLLMSALLFFGIYLAVLLLLSEPLATETVRGMMKSLRIKKGE